MRGRDPGEVMAPPRPAAGHGGVAAFGRSHGARTAPQKTAQFDPAAYPPALQCRTSRAVPCCTTRRAVPRRE